MEYEEHITQEHLLAETSPNADVPPDDDIDGWIDKCAALSQPEHKVLDRATRPVKMVLVKIWKLAFKVVNSTTILLPAWKECIESERLIPRDVTTKWNSTYDMLTFVLEHCPAVEKFTADLDNNLRDLELSRAEWDIVKQLNNVLMKMHNHYYSRTDESKAYQIAMSNPTSPIQAETAKWEPEWIETAEELVCTEFQDKYQDDEVEITAIAESVPAPDVLFPLPCIVSSRSF
ncbi:hypothetical protein B0H34DRAFT_668441 [Crassisporium funariophilum]|nr:hypothetical protein B0H34DRAFT_668441 [Crassisporium funariophilum]